MVMRKVTIALTLVMLAIVMPAIVRAALSLKVTGFSGGQIHLLATNIPGDIRGYCVWETSTNLVTWTPVVTNGVFKTWATNTFLTTNSATYYRAWVY